MTTERFMKVEKAVIDSMTPFSKSRSSNSHSLELEHVLNRPLM